LRQSWRSESESRLARLPPARAVDAIQGSAWWELMAPLRLIRRLIRRR
jgi:hypothetical protein